MTDTQSDKINHILWIWAAVFTICCLAGCGTEHYKTDADREVYRIIDRKWHNDLGPQNNYKIGDVSQSPNDVNIAVPLINSDRLSLAGAVGLFKIIDAGVNAFHRAVNTAAPDTDKLIRTKAGTDDSYGVNGVSVC